MGRLLAIDILLAHRSRISPSVGWSTSIHQQALAGSFFVERIVQICDANTERTADIFCAPALLARARRLDSPSLSRSATSNGTFVYFKVKDVNETSSRRTTMRPGGKRMNEGEEEVEEEGSHRSIEPEKSFFDGRALWGHER